MPVFKLPLPRIPMIQDDDFCIEEIPSNLTVYHTTQSIPEKLLERIIAAEIREATGGSTNDVSTVRNLGPNYRKLSVTNTWELFPGMDRKQHYGNALQRWRSVQHALSDNMDVNDSRKLWSVAESNSYHLLSEWWHNDGLESETTRSIRHWILSAAENRVNCRLLPRITRSRYNALMVQLWHAEFSAEAMAEGPLHSRRSMASSYAASHRIATYSIPKSISSESPGRGTLNNLDNDAPHIQDSQQNSRLSQPTASIQPCFWLDVPDSSSLPDDDNDRPFYLWDISAGRTVETRQLPRNARYAAVSHTWGRWRLSETTVLDPPGSVLWQLPKISLFDVNSLPELLRAAGLPVSYLWFDLFCIPQELEVGSRWRMRAKLEIAKQAQIFKNADFACMWLNFVPSWGPLEGAIQWLATVYDSCNGDVEESVTGRLLELAAAKADETTHMVTYKDGEKDMCGWFSSLWTLQEICLRPDMFLLDRNWQFLTAADGKFKVPFDHIVSLWGSVQAAVHRYEGTTPQAVSEIYFLLSESKLSDLVIIQPLTVLLLANQRYCRDRRAEAIMSVIGITKWFIEPSLPDLERLENEENLVLRRYPYQFVQEAKEKWGGSFFACADQSAVEVNRSGSMLPFSTGSVRSRSVMAADVTNTDHPSVKTWCIRRDGSVLLPEVGILARFRPGCGDGRDELPEQFARVVVPKGVPGFVETVMPEVNLRDYLASFQPDKEKYAVALLREGNGGAGVRGILLIQDEGNYFRKFGVLIFNAEGERQKRMRGGAEYEFPPSEEVGWIVR